MEVPLNPISKEEIHKLESILLFATLFRPEVIEIIKDPVERLTWVDSLAVAAGAIAREKARMNVSDIARELGRTEQTIRKHLKGETKAGEIVRETYELIKMGKLNELLTFASVEDIKKLKAENEELKKRMEELKKLKQELDELKNKIEAVREAVEKALS
jgi:probable regulatory domain-containing protein